MGTHNICHYKEVGKKYSGCNLKTTELLDCALIGVCAVIRLNMVITLFEPYHHTNPYKCNFSLEYILCTFIYFFMEAYVVGTNLNCLDKLR